ncbi:unnamed protein product [Blepharisma stoltei]|uniref:CBM20 domain-containing protein n=1 Tax=Blepharisma stoltei TaxID=1481888 RepID=A0AAU9IGJ3_9CILI|nr:unnamed protein product [Blepharisma stoltei]
MSDKGRSFISKDTDFAAHSSHSIGFIPKVRKFSESTSSIKIDENKFHKTQTLPTEKKRYKKSKNKLIDELNELKLLPLYGQALEEAIRLEKELAQGKTVDITFSMHYNTAFGERMIILGGHEVMGNWRSDRALDLEWTNGNIWKATISLSQKSKDIEYKYAIVKGNLVKWEGGDNRILRPSEAIQSGNRLLLNKFDIWRR